MSNIIFDIEKSISFEGDTGPYLQYTHARACSIVRKYDELHSQVEYKNNLLVELNTYEKDLLRHIQKYHDWIDKSAHAYSPNYLCEYLFNLAQKFNLFYTNSHIINETDEKIRQARILLTIRMKETLQFGLTLLGIEAPEKM